MKWIHKKYEYDDGDVNTVYAHFSLSLCKPTISFDRMRYDGLPLRALKIGILAIQWGLTHEWECLDDG